MAQVNMTKLLKRKKMTQGDLARTLEMSESHVCSILNRKIKYPHINTMRAIAPILGFQVDELWPESDPAENATETPEKAAERLSEE